MANFNYSQISTSALFCDQLKLEIVAEGFLAEFRTQLSTHGRSSRLNPTPTPGIPKERGMRAFPRARSVQPPWPLLEAAKRWDACHGPTPEGFCLGRVIRGPAPSAAVCPCMSGPLLRMAWYIGRSSPAEVPGPLSCSPLDLDYQPGHAPRTA